jgi:hypothetical protein
MPLKLKQLLVVLGAAALLGSCATVHRRHVPVYFDARNPIKRVAVLPIKNDTTDVDAPELIRKKMIQALEDRSYVVKAVKETDEILRDQMGITLGGQLDLTTPQKLGELLGVEGVLYGTLMDFDETTTGVVGVRKVRAKFRLINAASGQVVWERGLGVRSETHMQGRSGSLATVISRAADAKDKDVPWITIESTSTNQSNVGQAFAVEMGVKLLSKAIGIHLEYESSEMVRRVTENLPWGPGASDVPPVVTLNAPTPQIVIARPLLYGYYEYLDYGKRDLSALMISTSTDKNGKDIRLEIPFAKAGDNIRMDIDLTQTGQQAGAMPPGLGRMSVIHRGDTQTTYLLYPDVRRYMTSASTAKNPGLSEKPAIEKTRIGSEAIDKHPTDKYKVKITYRDGRVQEGFLWCARDLDGMTIRSDVGNSDGRVVTELKNILLKTSPSVQFEVPADFTEAQSSMDLMTEIHEGKEKP